MRKLSWLITLGPGTLLVIGFARLVLGVQNRMQERGVPLQEAKRSGDRLALMLPIAYASVWFWGCGHIKRWIWNQIKSGAQLNFVREN